MNKINVENSSLFIRDNLPVLRCIDSGVIDLIYLDPPFNTGRQWANPIEAAGKKALASFEDTWTWGDEHDDNMWELRQLFPTVPPLIEALAAINGGAWKAYLVYMGVRLVEMRRILKETGSIYFHCDPTMSHGVKIMMDAIFGQKNFRNEIVWCYTGPSSPGMKNFPRKHDIILRYTKSGKWLFNQSSVRVPYKDPNQTLRRVWDAGKGIGHKEVIKYRERGKPLEDWWHDVSPVGRIKKELTGYPTQKPLALLERIIAVSSNKGDMVLDPFCGCATTCVAAEQLGRQWIGIDLSENAAEIIHERLRKDIEVPLADPESMVNRPKILPKRTDIKSLPDKNIIKADLYHRQDETCYGCGEKCDLRFMHLDHLIPKARGGQDVERNLQLLCSTCNGMKNAGPMAGLIRKITAKRQAELGKAEQDDYAQRRRRK